MFNIDCGGMYDQTKTEFHTQSYPKAETLPMLCVWSIIVPEKKDANVEIISMSYSSGDTQSNSLVY